MATVGYYGPNVVTTTNVPGVPSSVSQGPPGSGPGSMGNVNVNPADDWISAPQTAEVYYGPGGQGTTNVNITDPSGGGYDAAAAQAAAAQAAAAQAAAAQAAAAAGTEGTGILSAAGGTFGPLFSQVLKGVQSTDRFFEKLASGKPLDAKDKIILANLIAANKRNPKVLGDLGKYLEEYDVSEKYLKGRLDEEKGELEDTDYQSLIDQYLARKPEGLKESLGTMTGDLWNLATGKETSPEGIMTLENLRKELGPEGLAYLKANDPDAYYSFTQPQTSGDLEELANLSTQGLEGTDPDLVQKIFDARQELDRRKDRHDGGGGGIADLSPVAQLAATTPAATTTAMTTPATTTTAMTTPTPFDYSQWPQFTSAYPGYNQYPGPNYVNQGLGQGPNFDYWNQIANAYPGMGNYG